MIVYCTNGVKIIAIKYYVIYCMYHYCISLYIITIIYIYYLLIIIIIIK